MFGGELEKGCGNQVYDYSTSIDLPDIQIPDSVFSSPVSSGHDLRGVSPQRHEDRNGGEASTIQQHHISDTSGQAMIDMQEKSHISLPPITPSAVGVSSSPGHLSAQRNVFDLPASEEPLCLRQQVAQQVAQPVPMEQTVTTQPSSSRVAPQWLQPLNREVAEGCEAGRERPRWLVPQHSTEPKLSPASSSSMLPELPCNPGRVCRGTERTVNGSQWNADSLDVSCDLLEELGEQKPDRPISGRRSSFRNNVVSVSAKQTEEQNLRAATLSNTGSQCYHLQYVRL